jgi:hypothetical protein
MGRPNKIHSPEHLWELFQAYKKHTKDNPFIVKDFVGKDAETVYREKERPLTIEGFENYCADQEIIGDLSHYFANTRGRYKRFLTICSRIRREVRADQIEGGMAGMYNPSITQRLNNLVEKVQQTIVEQPLFNLDESDDNDIDQED